MEARLRKHALEIFRASLRAADPVEAVLRHVRIEDSTLLVGRRRYKLGDYRNIRVIGAGKASAAMAQGVEKILGKRVSEGVVVTKYGHSAPLKRVRVVESGHPVPDAAGVDGAAQIAEMARRSEAGDLILFLISGGASALTPAPAEPITLEEKQAVTRLLLECGADIYQLNTVRKHMSALKGGQLARLAAPAHIVSLILSDVIGDSLDTIGSGPTVPDTTTFGDSLAILDQFGLRKRAPRSVVERFERGAAGEIEETPKPGDPVFKQTQNLIVGSNSMAVDAAAEKARQLGYRALVMSTFVQGETREVARVHAAIAREVHSSGRPLRRPCCILSGGETTVTIQGDGLGGRNQEFVLAAAMDLAGLPATVTLSGGTDGTDGPTDAAGAIADGLTMAAARNKGLDAQAALSRNDSYHFFEALGDLVKTGPTRTNVMDVRLVLIGDA